MKTDVMPSVVQIGTVELKSLLTEVKETVAAGLTIQQTRKKIFGATDMWNIRRNFKSAGSMIRR